MLSSKRRNIRSWEGLLKLATYRSNGRNKVALVHAGDTRLFDLASASERAGWANPAFNSMLELIDNCDASLDAASDLFSRYGQDQDLSSDVAASELLAPLPEPRQMRDGMS